MKVTVVHRGARDGFQAALALEEAGLLETLVTDLYWPGDRAWARSLERFIPQSLSGALRSRYADQLPSSAVSQTWGSGLVSMTANKSDWLPYNFERDAVRWCDRTLGRRAGQLATEKGTALLSYSYYAHSAFANYNGGQPRILFQMHPHPVSVRKILGQERLLHPECAASLDKEWELALADDDFRRLVDESASADYWIAASQFTKRTLVEEGIPAERVTVIPYGIDAGRFAGPKPAHSKDGPLKLLFVGTIAQRKGIKYLLEAVDMLPKGSVELTVCGRPVDDLSLFRSSRVPIHLHPSVSSSGLLRAYREADVFVFPSLAEGFAHVLLEAMASGLPIISTNRTAAPDLLREGQEGFIAQPGDSTDLAQQIEYFLRHRDQVQRMSEASLERAEHFTWARFRKGVAGVVGNIVSGEYHQSIPAPCFQF